jgi:hypothetical protein
LFISGFFSDSPTTDLLRLYERWAKTGSTHGSQLLVERGVVLTLAAKMNRVQ